MGPTDSDHRRDSDARLLCVRSDRHVDFPKPGERRLEVCSPSAGRITGIIGPDGLIGHLQIERLGISVVLIEGTSNYTLRRAVCHIAGSALPGQSGNIGIAGLVTPFSATPRAASNPGWSDSVKQRIRELCLAPQVRLEPTHPSINSLTTVNV